MNNKLIVLDLDETLFNCDVLSFDGSEYKFRLRNNSSYYAMKRPYMDDFIKYIKENYEYGVYTAASKDYALKHCKVLNLDPKFLLHQENCSSYQDPVSRNHHLLKELSKLKEYSSLSNMIAIDDRYESYANDRANLIKVEPFYRDLRDDVLLKLVDYLEKIKDVKDVREVDKSEWYSNI
jgi:RNA polymerase II subunit A small phosphatase-like protein